MIVRRSALRCAVAAIVWCLVQVSAMDVCAAGKKTEKSAAVTQITVERSAPWNTLQESDSRPVRQLYSPVVSAEGDVLYGVNFLNGAIESWELASGAIREPVFMADTLRYLYRTAPPTDTVWQALEGRGFNPARFVSLCVAGGDLYALASLPVSYTLIPTPIQSDTGTVVMQWPNWKWRQAVVRFHKGVVSNVYRLPEGLVFTTLVADGAGVLGGTCQEMDRFSFSTSDSTLVLSLLQAKPDGNVKKIASWKAASSDMASITALSSLASDGTLWYCSPDNKKFFTRKKSGAVKKLALSNSLKDCTGFVHSAGAIMPDPEQPVKNTYRLRGMLPCDGGMAVLMVPAAAAHSAPLVLQRYDQTGVLRSEVALSSPALSASSTTWLLSVRNNMALFLIETDDLRWRTETVVLPAL